MIRIRPRADTERTPWQVRPVGVECLWPGCDWSNGFLVVDRGDGVALGATCTMHRFRTPDEWAEVLT